MKKYRIIEHQYIDGNINYEVQKRFLGFLWWYNWKNIDGVSTGFYDDKVEAMKAILKDKEPHRYSICYEE